jgi:hypothetical protein
MDRIALKNQVTVFGFACNQRLAAYGHVGRMEIELHGRQPLWSPFYKSTRGVVDGALTGVRAARLRQRRCAR